MDDERIHPLQALVNGMSANMQKARSETQMTLGKLIEALDALPADMKVSGLTDRIMSYRGYYCDLAIEPGEGTDVRRLWNLAKAAMGEIFVGYKGGDYQMGRNTPVWVASYGACGDRLMGLNATSGVVVPVMAPDED